MVADKRVRDLSSSFAVPSSDDQTMMNFGAFGPLEFVFLVLLWALPFVLLVWFIRTVASIAASLRDIAERLGSVERAIRDGSRV